MRFPKKTELLLILLLIFKMLVNNCQSQEVIKINVNPQKVITETNCGNGSLLFDEQYFAGDPKNGNGGNIINLNNSASSNINTWECGYNSTVVYPAYCYIDLGKTYQITDIYLRDVNASGIFSIYSGYPGTWNFVFSDNCTGYNSWNAHHINNLSTRYLRFKKDQVNARIAEIVIYGYLLNLNNSDTIRPDAISDLIVDSVSKTNAFLSWTKPNDNSDSIFFYELRSSKLPINQYNFLNAKKFDSLKVYGLEGNRLNCKIDNLQSGSPYYFAIISYDNQYNFSAISNIAYAKTKLDLNCNPYQIIIESDMIINEMAIGDIDKIADEQLLYKDSAYNTIKCTSFWNVYENNSVKSWHFPLTFLIDLGSEYTITETNIFNSGTKSTNIQLYYNNLPFSNRDSLSLLLDSALIWKKLINQTFFNTRYLKVKVNSTNTKIGEFVIKGYPTSYPIENPINNLIKRIYPLMNEFIGINGLINEPIGKLNCAGFIRQYHNWIWNEGISSSAQNPYIKNDIEWALHGGLWNFDLFYENVSKYNLVICPVIQDKVPWITNYTNYYKEAKPIDSINIDPTNPAAYKNHANFIFQFVARYGNKITSDNSLQLALNQDRFSGKNWIKYFENWNEQNKNWRTRNEFFSPYEFAAMSSADYDGHERTLHLGFNSNLGLKNADSTAKLVMGGISAGTIDYIKAIRFWSFHNRSDHKTPFDVLNTHQYFFAVKNNISQGISPEEYEIKLKISKFINYRDKYMPDKEVWLSEFGYNSSANTLYSTPLIGNCSREETQGRWIIRSLLELSSTGLDKAVIYRLSDEEQDTVTGNTYCTSGITSKKSLGFIPKPAWYYVSTLKNHLWGFRFEKEIQTSTSNIKVFQYKHDSSAVIAYAVWCPTSNDKLITDYNIQISNNYKRVKEIQFENGFSSGVESEKPINQGSILINISEKPKLLILSPDSIYPKTPKTDKKIYLDSTMVVNENNKGNANLLVDEQFLAEDPFMGSNSIMLTNWDYYKLTDYPISSYIDLGYERNISQIFLFDANSVGEVTISKGSPNNWTPLYTQKLDHYLFWAGKVVDIKTRFIRITKKDRANMNEIILYEK